MNNEILFLVLFGVLCVTAGFFIYRIQFLVNAFFELKRQRRVFPYFEKVKDGTTCTSIHTWHQINLALGSITGSHNVCSDCGLISGYDSELKLNAPALEVFKNELNLRTERNLKKEKMIKDSSIKKDEIMNRLVRDFVQKFDGDIHQNGNTLQQFFRHASIDLESMYVTLRNENRDG